MRVLWKVLPFPSLGGQKRTAISITKRTDNGYVTGKVEGDKSYCWHEFYCIN
jgi:hypothetical protein